MYIFACISSTVGGFEAYLPTLTRLACPSLQAAMWKEAQQSVRMNLEYFSLFRFLGPCHHYSYMGARVMSHVQIHDHRSRGIQKVPTRCRLHSRASLSSSTHLRALFVITIVHFFFVGFNISIFVARGCGTHPSGDGARGMEDVRARGRMYIEPADPKKKTRPRVRIRYRTSVLLIRRSRNKLAHVVQTSTIPTISQIESIMSQTLENAFTSTYVLRAMAMVMQVLHRIFGTFSVQVGVRRSRIDPPTPHPLFLKLFPSFLLFFYPFIYVSTFRLWSDQIRVKGWRRTEAYRSGGREARAAYEQNTMLI